MRPIAGSRRCGRAEDGAHVPRERSAGFEVVLLVDLLRGILCAPAPAERMQLTVRFLELPADLTLLELVHAGTVRVDAGLQLWRLRQRPRGWRRHGRHRIENLLQLLLENVLPLPHVAYLRAESVDVVRRFRRGVRGRGRVGRLAATHVGRVGGTPRAVSSKNRCGQGPCGRDRSRCLSYARRTSLRGGAPQAGVRRHGSEREEP